MQDQIEFFFQIWGTKRLLTSKKMTLTKHIHLQE